MLKGHTKKTHAKNNYNQPPTYAASVSASLILATLTETDIYPEASAAQESHHIPDTFSLPVRKTHFLFSAIHYSKGQIFTDKSVWLLFASSHGHSYTLVLYNCNRNYIHSDHMPTRHAKSILAAYQKAIAVRIKSGLQPKLQQFNNECSLILQTIMDTQEIYFQLEQNHIHHHNADECAMYTFKSHLIYDLCSTDENFALNPWENCFTNVSSH